ncbi:hypothetical protein Taro_020362 [Colocasia esculenta]|uniref:aldehyde oxygenase (deformylating) n=1 Tax=Colocasia esculenta TaxID=4460 RepID=A0A843UZE5_COLES|nr:hypothetical protein [Colocasia esculenta]
MAFLLSTEELLPVIVPLTLYWVASGMYSIAMGSKKHRLFTPEEEEAKNLVTRRQVLVVVLINQAMQIVLAVLTISGKGGDGGQHDKAGPALLPSLLRYPWQLTVGVLIMDAWGYFWHRLSHENRFLYKHVHSLHHRLVVPYAYGSQYQHPIDSFMADGVGSVLATLATGMSPRTATVFLALLTLKGVDDHCGLWLPGSPTSRLCNNGAMHAVHHQHHGIKSNYSVYFLVTWDKLFGTYMPYSVEEREGGGYQLRSGTTTKDL